MIHLNEVLYKVGVQLGLDPRQLVEYAAEDTLKGYYDGGGEHAIPYAADGQFLYALVRALKPNKVLEVGTSRGGSAHHIALALEANGAGELFTVDIDPFANINGIPKLLRSRVVTVRANIDDYLIEATVRGYPDAPQWDFIHEDGAHSIHQVHGIYAALPQLMPHGGVIVSHDTSTGVREDVLEGIRKAGFDEPPCYEYAGSPCGFSILQYEGIRNNQS